MDSLAGIFNVHFWNKVDVDRFQYQTVCPAACTFKPATILTVQYWPLEHHDAVRATQSCQRWHPALPAALWIPAPRQPHPLPYMPRHKPVLHIRVFNKLNQSNSLNFHNIGSKFASIDLKSLEAEFWPYYEETCSNYRSA